MTDTMRAIVLDAPGPPDALTIRELPVPTPAAGWVLIEVKAFGLNRSDLHTRQGLAHRRSRHATRAVDPHPRRHVFGGHGGGSSRQTAEHDRALNDAQREQDRSPDRYRRGPRPDR